MTDNATPESMQRWATADELAVLATVADVGRIDGAVFSEDATRVQLLRRGPGGAWREVAVVDTPEALAP